MEKHASDQHPIPEEPPVSSEELDDAELVAKNLLESTRRAAANIRRNATEAISLKNGEAPD